MSLHRKIISEYINQIIEDIPGACVHKKAEKIVRGYDCKYLFVPRSESKPILCLLHQRETVPECYCCWAKCRPVLKEFKYGDKTILENR